MTKNAKNFWNDKARILQFKETGIIKEAQMRIVDTNAQAFGCNSEMLMEKAGSEFAAIIKTIKQNAEEQTKLLMLCGKGNNGGDGMVAARHLQWEMDVTVLYYDGQNMSPDTRNQLNCLKATAVKIIPFKCTDELNSHEISSLFTSADIIGDALLGIGSHGNIRDPIKTCVRLANQSKKPVISADVETCGITATKVAAFHRPKKDNPNNIVCDIGIPIQAEICTGRGDPLLIKKRDSEVHKGIGGNILIIGGGPYHGAPSLAGLAALRAGADIVRVFSPANVLDPNLIHVKADGPVLSDADIDTLIPYCHEADVVVAGPGLGKNVSDIILTLGPHCKKAVFDADALNNPLPTALESTLYTPHAGEYNRITKRSVDNDIITRAEILKSDINDETFPGTVLLKGPVDIISDGDHVKFNLTGDPAMTVGGTGDILAGVCGALMVSLSAFEAGCIGSYAVGIAGERAALSFGYGLTATDILLEIPKVLYTETDKTEVI